MTQKLTYTREEAAALLGCSTRTVDRLIPPGTAGRTDARVGVHVPRPQTVEIARHLVEALLPAPGGDDNGE